MTARVDVDSSVAVAWRAFEHRLTAELVELPLGSSLGVGLPVSRVGRPPRVLRFKARPATLLMTAPLAPARGGARVRGLAPAGVPSVKVFSRGAELIVASWATTALREAYGVVHPSFLTLAQTDAEGTTALRTGVVPRSHAAAAAIKKAELSDRDGGAVANTREELEDLVKQTLEAIVGASIDRDSDGDLPLIGEHGVAYVRVRQDRPVVEVFAFLQEIDEDGVAAAQDCVNQWNELSAVETYLVVGHQIHVRMSVLGRRYEPSSVVTAVNEVMRALKEYAVAVAQREEDEAEEDEEDHDEEDHDEGAGRDAEPATEATVASGTSTRSRGRRERSGSADVSEAALTIMQLEAAEPGSVSPALAARIYDYNIGYLLGGIRDVEMEVIAWRESIVEARSRDEEEAVVCEGEMRACQRTVDLLRSALRITVER